MTRRRRGRGAPPDAIRAAVERAWRRHLGRTARIADARPVGGGSISPCARLETEAGDVAFLKWRSGDGARRMFVEEARALAALRDARALRVPHVFGHAGADAQTEDAAGVPADDAAADGRTGWILLEWLEPGRAGRAAWRALGTGLARLHRARGPAFGWPTDNFIGSLPQSNAASDDWADFWRERRLRPQLRRARDAGLLDAALATRFDALLAALDDRIAAAAADDGASLLHGDLWSGNVHMLGTDVAAVIDPASYHGHREVDLAMSELFGGFDAAFYDAYGEAWPLSPGYRRGRRAIYQLYYLLVHVNLFGAGYVGGTAAALERAGF